jgi:hypothetical protein
MPEKKWKYNDTVHQLFIYVNKANDSLRKEVLYNIAHRVWGTREASQADYNVFQWNA